MPGFFGSMNLVELLSRLKIRHLMAKQTAMNLYKLGQVAFSSRLVTLDLARNSESPFLKGIHCFLDIHGLQPYFSEQ